MESMDDNVWEYPFGDLDDDDEIFFYKPEKPEWQQFQVNRRCAAVPYRQRRKPNVG